jgi:hypothetical protein
MKHNARFGGWGLNFVKWLLDLVCISRALNRIVLSMMSSGTLLFQNSEAINDRFSSSPIMVVFNSLFIKCHFYCSSTVVTVQIVLHGDSECICLYIVLCTE